MKFTASIIFAFLALSCNAQYREMRHSKITPTNTVVVAIPDWAKAEEPPASGDWQYVTNAYDTATNAYTIATNSYDVTTNTYAIATNALTRQEAQAMTNALDATLRDDIRYRLKAYDSDHADESEYAQVAKEARAIAEGSIYMDAEQISEGIANAEIKSNKITDLPLNSQPFNLSSNDYFSTLGLDKYIDRLIANGKIESPSNLVEITDTHVPYATNKYPTAVSVQGQLLDIWAKIRGMTNTIVNIDESIGSINSNIEIIDEYIRDIHPDDYINKVSEAEAGEIAVFGNGDGSLIQSHVMLADVTNDIHTLIVQTNSFAQKDALNGYVNTNDVKWGQLSTITTNSTSGDGIAYTLGERAGGANLGQNSFVQGRNSSASGLWSVAMGDNNAARVKGTMALGVKSLASNNFAYVWSGVDSSGVTPRYGSHGIGSYSINPVDDVYGFWIGERNLYDIFRHFATNETNVTITRNIGDEEDPIEAVEVATAMPLVKKSEFNSVASSVNAMWSTLYGESVWIAVTNYMRQIAGTVPSFRLWEVRDSNTNLVYSSAEEIEHVVTQKVNAAESRIMAAMPSTAWGAYQSSGVENPSPEDITVVNSPKIMLSSGYTWQKCIETGSASVWVLKANGIMNLGGGEGAETNGYFRITDAEGNAQFEVIKTSDQEVGAIATDTDFDSSNNFTIRYNSSSASHPTLYCALALADDFEGEDANGDINNLGISVTWAQDGGTNWIATVHQDSPSSSLFCHAKMTIQGTNLIKNSAPSSLDGGIYINNTRYRLGTATISGHLVLTLEAW